MKINQIDLDLTNRVKNCSFFSDMSARLLYYFVDKPLWIILLMLFAICFSFLDLGAPSTTEEFDSEEESSVHFVIREPVSEVN